MKSKLRAVKGELPTKYSCVDWSDTKWLAFVKFIDFWVEEGSFRITKEKMEIAEERAKDEPYWEEFNVRLDKSTKDEKMTNKSFQMRLMAFARNPLSWLKENQYAVTPEMLSLMKGNPRMEWALDPIKEVTSKSGVPHIALDKDDVTNEIIKNPTPQVTNPKSPLVMYEQGLMDLAGLFKSLTSGIKASELKKMSAKDRLNIANKLFGSLNKAFSGKSPSTVVFKQMNVNNATKEDLEKAMLDYSQSNLD